MAKIEKFEDIQAWQCAREVVKDVYEITKGPVFSKDYGLRDQIRRAAVSAMSNIAEGFERYSSSEFIQFLNIARASIGETRSQLYVSLDLGYIEAYEFDRLKDKCETVSRQIWNFMKYLRKTRRL